MAPTSYASSMEELHTLSTTPTENNSKATVTLPQSLPDATDAHPYVNSAVTRPGRSANSSRLDEGVLERRLEQLDDKIGRGFDKEEKSIVDMHKRVGRIEDLLAGIRGDLPVLRNGVGVLEVDTGVLKANALALVQHTSVLKQDVNVLKKDIQGLKKVLDKDVHALKFDVGKTQDDVRSLTEEIHALENTFYYHNQVTQALQRNRLVRTLDAEIEVVAANTKLLSGEISWQLPNEFPLTVNQFWNLKSNIPALQSLARTYNLRKWDIRTWMSLGSGDAEVNRWPKSEGAIAADPERCHRALATKWGLDYDRLETPAGVEVRPRGQKRKAENEAESRRVKSSNTRD
ncbi:hypothetical protein LTR50_006295 [Elasticomyces elasticus]|nr:hypothetical protein LTR50_006295 [Elasticomyces elasticus]